MERQKRKYKKIDDKVRILKDEERAKEKRKDVFRKKLEGLALQELEEDDMLRF